jgi:GT2 family glycosyltransferase
MQPSTAMNPVIVPAFIGFAHLVRRSIFCELSGYRESFEFYGEEKELCLRLLDAGYKTVYLPEARVAHVIDRGSRDLRRYLRMVSRNDCLNTLYNDPIMRVLWMLPARVALYFRMRRHWKISDPGGAFWLVRNIAGHLPDVLQRRKPVSRATLARWRQLQRNHVAYERA